MKKLVYFVFVIMLGSACSKNEGPLPQEPTAPESAEEPVAINLRADAKKGNIFQMIQFGLYAEEDFSLLDLTEAYDSLVWTASGTDGRYKVYEHGHEPGYSYSHLALGWGHSFFLPGEYETVLTGYKDDKAIRADTLTVTIADGKDFLCYDWNEITARGEGGTGYADVLSDRNFTTSVGFNDNGPSVNLFLWDTWESEESVGILSDHISSLYSAPVYGLGDESLVERYEALFKNRREDEYPLSIWITEASNIVLVKWDTGYGAYHYEIHAEPRGV